MVFEAETMDEFVGCDADDSFFFGEEESFAESGTGFVLYDFAGVEEIDHFVLADLVHCFCVFAEDESYAEAVWCFVAD